MPHGAKTKLASQFGVSPEAVRRALRFVTESNTAVCIRKEAVKRYGGTEVELSVKE